MSDNPTVLVLREARRLIAERGWCQGAYARDSNGAAIDLTDPTAASFCVLGACYRQMGGSGIALPIEAALRQALPDCSKTIASWQDSLPFTDGGRADVLRLFDRAIDVAKRQPDGFS